MTATRRLMEADEAGTLAALKERRKTILEPVVKEHGGRIVKVMGDGVLMEFASAVKAVEAAIALQQKFAAANDGVPKVHHILIRIGINLGDVVGEGADIYGDGVNIAARLEPMAEPGGICISSKVYDEVRGKTAAIFTEMGERRLKDCANRAIRLNPQESQMSMIHSAIACAHYTAERYSKAADWAQRAYRVKPKVSLNLLIFAATLAMNGQMTKAKEAAKNLCQREPRLRLANLNDLLVASNPAVTGKFAEGLRKAGLPE